MKVSKVNGKSIRIKRGSRNNNNCVEDANCSNTSPILSATMSSSTGHKLICTRSARRTSTKMLTSKQRPQKRSILTGTEWIRSIWSKSTPALLLVFASILFLLVLPALFGEQCAQAIELRRRVKRALYELPDGSEQILGANLRTTFTCDGLGYGYYADQDNDCKIFHICQSFRMSDGSIYNNHWSFMCGNQTVFNQVSLACSHPEDSIPCESARDFYHVNDYFGDVRAPSVKESDLNQAQDLISRSYGSRISSPA